MTRMEKNMYNEAFDPLKAKYDGTEEVVIKALKREITNILNSYVGWYDPFCELIQNALDAIDKRRELQDGFEPCINISISLKDNRITVTDNGIGFKESEYIKFLAPNFSFKPENRTRGHKGVGATYLAYGFNYIQIATKSDDFYAIGEMKDAKKWLYDPAPAGNPKVKPCDNVLLKEVFDLIDRGTQMTIVCDGDSFPKDLSWIGVGTADSWSKILRVETGLGQINLTGDLKVVITVEDKDGEISFAEFSNPKYLMIDEFIPEKSKSVDEIKAEMDKRYEQYGPGYKMPSKYSNLEAVFGDWNADKICSEIKLSEAEKELVHKYNIHAIFSYVYSLAVWDKIDRLVDIRKGNHLLYGGIQLAANNMPQGELIQIPLTKNIGRQKQANILIHFDNCSADLGRKGFNKEITDFGKELARKMMDGPLMKMRQCFKANTGASPDLRRENDLAEWKKMMSEHESQYPLSITNPNFFNPMQDISLTSTPTREQDVIALFNQLLAGGVVRAIKIMSTNERSTYDSLFRIMVSPQREIQLYDKYKNPLGVSEEVYDELVPDDQPFITEPKVLEYKYSIDGLVEDIETGVKNTNDINLVVAWEAGENYKDNYIIESLLINGNESLRQYHGVTHTLYNANTNERICDLILLKDLILFLNGDPSGVELQEQYDE